MHVEIAALATATPPHRLDQSAALSMVQRICCEDERQSRLAAALYKHSGVQNRCTVVPFTEAYCWINEPGNAAARKNGPSTEERMALYNEHALPLAIKVASEAIRRSGFEPTTITHVVTASCTGFGAPGIDTGLIYGMQLRPTTERVHVGYMGCHGAINALRVAGALARSVFGSRILVCAVELCSLHYCFHWDQAQMLGNALFADGASAVVLSASETEATDTAHSRWRLAATGSYLFPGTADVMTWSIGNHGFEMTISPRLPELIEMHLSEWLTRWLGEHELRVEDIQSWAVHPGGPRILESVESALGLTTDQTDVSRTVLSGYGNMSSATVLFILQELQNSGHRTPCVMLGFGPGLMAEAALLV